MSVHHPDEHHLSVANMDTNASLQEAIRLQMLDFGHIIDEEIETDEEYALTVLRDELKEKLSETGNSVKDEPQSTGRIPAQELKASTRRGEHSMVSKDVLGPNALLERSQPKIKIEGGIDAEKQNSPRKNEQQSIKAEQLNSVTDIYRPLHSITLSGFSTNRKRPLTATFSETGHSHISGDDVAYKRARLVDNQQGHINADGQVLSGRQPIVDDSREHDVRHSANSSRNVNTGDTDSGPSSTVANPLSQPQCTACLDYFRRRDMRTLDCEHSYCKDCFKSSIDIGLQNINSFPPKCCGIALDFSKLGRFVYAAQKKKYDQLLGEQKAKSPLYCSNCHAFFPAKNYHDDFGICGKCHRKTCVQCKVDKRDHVGLTKTACPNELENSGVGTLLKDNGWQSCPRCMAVVMKDGGCKHIHCRCGANFCYVCGKLRCECPGLPPTVVQTPARQEPADVRIRRVIDRNGLLRCHHETDGAQIGVGICGGCLGHDLGLMACTRCNASLCAACIRVTEQSPVPAADA